MGVKNVSANEKPKFLKNLKGMVNTANMIRVQKILIIISKAN